MAGRKIGRSGRTLILADEVMDHLMGYRQTRLQDREAGGQLFALFAKSSVIIKCATGPHFLDRRTRRSFRPCKYMEHLDIKRMFKNRLHYIGDWHTHPESRPQPSSEDIQNLNRIFRKSNHELSSFLMLIMGTDALPEGLFAGLVDGKNIRRLRLKNRHRLVR